MDQEFSLNSETRDNCLIMTTSGYINNVGGEALATEFSKHFEKGTKEVVIDLAGRRL